MKLSLLLESISISELKRLEKYLDSVWNELGIDITFTYHFMKRVGDVREKKQRIKKQEITDLFLKAYREYGHQFSKLSETDFEKLDAIFIDLSTKLNVPFQLKWNEAKKELELVSKTIMRKDDFKTSDKKYTVR